MKTAARYTRAPSEYLGYRDEHKDRVLEYAYTLYEDGLCDCGWPRHICQNPDNDGYFKAEATICHSKAEVDRKTGEKDYKPDPGELIFTEYTRPTDKPLRALSTLEGSKDPAAEANSGEE